MKPIRLKIAGLNSFKEVQTIDFDTLGQDNLFCISGSTGSGKTTIVDGIILALYGDSKRGKLEETINLNCDKASVELIIELEGEIYIITREIRRSASSNKAKIYKPNNDIIADGITSVNNFIKEKIGLEKDQFTKVVMLQQGEFDKFLSDSKTDRMSTIEKLTDISKYKKAIRLLNEDETSAKNALEIDENRLNEYNDVSDEILEQKKNEIKQQEEKKTLLLATKEEVQNKLNEVRKKASEYEIFKKREEDINALVISLQDIKREKLAVEKEKEQVKLNAQRSEKIESQSQEIAKKRELLLECKGLVDTVNSYEENIKVAREEYSLVLVEKKAFENELILLSAQKEELENQYGFLPSSATIQEKQIKDEYLALANEFTLQQSKQESIDTTQKQIQKEKEELNQVSIQYNALTNGVNAWKEKVETLKNQKESIVAKKEKMQNEDMLSAVLSSIKIGDICPICRNEVTSLSHIEKQDFSLVEKELKDISFEYDQAQQNLTNSDKSLSAVITSYNSIKDSIEKKEKEVQKEIEQLGAIITQKQVLFAKEKSESATKYLMILQNCDNKKQQVEGKNAELEKRKQEGQNLANKQSKTTKILLEKCGTADKEIIEKKLLSLKEEFDKLSAEQKQINEFANQITQKEIKILEQENSKLEQLENLKKEHTICEKVDIQMVKETEEKFKQTEKECLELVQLSALLTAQYNGLVERNNIRKELFNSIVAKRKQYDLLKELKNLVKGASFTEFLVDAFMEEITESASEQMSELSSGQYSLYYEDGKFFAQDAFSGNEGRNVNTLSGGERFLASLSLAIAISKRTAQSKDYGFFFIDEGFGTLDENTISTVCYSLENLAKDTMVGIITHRKELIERIPAVLEVTKTDAEKGSECKIKM